MTSRKTYTCIALDDDPLFLKTIEAYINEIPWLQLIAKFTNSVEGTVAITKEKPDLLILDYQMPYLDGLDVIDTLEKKPKVLVISGHLDELSLPEVEADKIVSKARIRSFRDLESVIQEIL
ncbi:MAG: response regulator [Cyclobacteriaceae bacterium]